MVAFKNNKISELASVRLNTEATVFQAELYAIELAAKHIKKNASKGEFYNIFSDSRAALMAISSNEIVSKTVLSTIKALNDAAKRGCNITLLWIRAHVGLYGNELADHAAKVGAEESTEMRALPVSPCNIRQNMHAY